MSNLIPRSEFNTLGRRWLDELWNDFDAIMKPSNLFSTVKSKTRFNYPRMNIKSEDKEYVVEAAVPGLAKEDVKVEYSDGMLTISGNTQNEQEDNTNGYVVRELHKSSFTRSVVIDEDLCDVFNIDASVDNGVLKIKIPKKVLDKPEPKRIIEVK